MRRKHHEEPLEAEQEPEVAPEDPASTLGPPEAREAALAGDTGSAETALVEPPEEAVRRLESEAASWKDRALRAAADLENYRRRAVRERDEALLRGKTEVLARIVEVVDDLARVAELDPATSTADALHEGMQQIERKFLKTLELAGVERVDPVGQTFDPNRHEAVATMPAPSEKEDHTVGAVYQHGYMYRDTLLRPARVAVLTWSNASGDEG